jgi:hypothetical protein
VTLFHEFIFKKQLMDKPMPHHHAA